MISLFDLLRTDGFSPRRVAATSGGEFASPCPACGGRDRFRSWPEAGRWWCRQCDKSGDLPGYMMTFHGLSYPEACRQLGVELREKSILQNQEIHKRKWEPKAVFDPIPAVWLQKAAAFVGWAEKKLWGKEGARALKYLEGRGLRRETIRAFMLGWNPSDLYRDRAAWGLPEKKNSAGRAVKLWLPEGWVIPVFRADAISRIKIRRPNPALQGGSNQRYIHVAGGHVKPMLLGKAKAACVVVESELDALLLHQVAGDVVTPIALGSANIRPDLETVGIINSAPLIVSLDFDAAGGKESWNFWAKTFSRARCWPVPVGKDPGEAFKSGVDLRAWIKGILEEIAPSNPLRETFE